MRKCLHTVRQIAGVSFQKRDLKKIHHSGKLMPNKVSSYGRPVMCRYGVVDKSDGQEIKAAGFSTAPRASCPL